MDIRHGTMGIILKYILLLTHKVSIEFSINGFQHYCGENNNTN